jgi:hypothetical protein
VDETLGRVRRELDRLCQRRYDTGSFNTDEQLRYDRLTSLELALLLRAWNDGSPAPM